MLQYPYPAKGGDPVAYLLCFFTLFSLGALALGIHTFLFPRSTEDAAAKTPREGLAFFLFLDALLLSITLFTWRTEFDPWLPLLFSFLALVGGMLILDARNVRILYNEDGFFRYNLWGRCRRYSYGDITAISGTTDQDVILWVGKHPVRVDFSFSGKDAFLAQAQKQYAARHNGSAIPRKRPKWDVYNGNANGSGAEIVLVLYGVLVLLCFGLAILGFFGSRSDADPSLESGIMTFSRYEVRRGDLMLYIEASPAVRYEVSGYWRQLTDPNSFLDGCDSGAQFRVEYTVPKNGNTRTVWSISGRDGTEYLTIAEHRQYLRGNMLVLCRVSGFFALLVVFFLVMSIRVGRHPERYSRRFVHLFFKPGYINTKNCKK